MLCQKLTSDGHPCYFNKCSCVLLWSQGVEWFTPHAQCTLIENEWFAVVTLSFQDVVRDKAPVNYHTMTRPDVASLRKPSLVAAIRHKHITPGTTSRTPPTSAYHMCLTEINAHCTSWRKMMTPFEGKMPLPHPLTIEDVCKICASHGRPAIKFNTPAQQHVISRSRTLINTDSRPKVDDDAKPTNWGH